MGAREFLKRLNMEISISDCKGKESKFVEGFSKHLENNYSICFGEYELSFIPKNLEHLGFLVDSFLKRNISANEPDVSIELKKGRKIFLKGVYEVSEEFTSKDNRPGIEIHVVDGINEWRVYLIPDKEENLEKMLHKVFF